MNRPNLLLQMSERQVPIEKNEMSILDNEFSSIRERFESEMRKMEDEMARFRSMVLDHERNIFINSIVPGIPATLFPENGIGSPLIQDNANGGKELKLRFDVSQYAPEEIVVKTVDHRLQVSAKHEEKSDTKSVYREYNREFLLPRGLDPAHITSNLSKDGILTIQAPLPALPGPGGPSTETSRTS
ncbi:heat shock protein beta-6-like isoform X2 [Varroa jacobsoni]|uniref:heat shock protein beta-6-like isoform X2 n=1 Tax=Varroa jacobsoni TaxID=62625 RepID=UPI000BF9EF29|nr:heat shock protein beta-6-like isoform X2 [Varroa jacobsoni]